MGFAPFAIDPARHVLVRDGKDVALSPHLVDILWFLASQRGNVVSKDTLLERFWPDVHITENTLTRAIADIRKTLGDDSTSPTYIQTVARRGYRFVAAVETPAPTEPLDPFRDWSRGRLSLETLDPTRLPEAVASFQTAIARTPDYAPAHAGLANAYFLQHQCTRAQNSPDRAALMRAIDSARKASTLDPSLGEAWATLAFALAADGDGNQARAAARHATALEPTSWRHHFRLAVVSWGEERLREVDRTLGLLPDFAPARFLSAMVFIARQATTPALAAAAAGAAAQSRQVTGASALFPAFGLHWLHGLLLLREGQIGAALMAFAAEIDAAQEERIYSGEFRVNAQVGAGYAHLAADDAAGAADAFRIALETLPRNGRALVGLYQALRHTSLATEAAQLLPQIDAVIHELANARRFGEAALIRAAVAAAQGDVTTGCVTLQQLLNHAPAGQTGWLLPIDPALAPLRSAPAFERLTAQLAARAA